MSIIPRNCQSRMKPLRCDIEFNIEFMIYLESKITRQRNCILLLFFVFDCLGQVWVLFALVNGVFLLKVIFYFIPASSGATV